MERDALHARFFEARNAVQQASDFLLSHENLRTAITAKAENDYVTSADRECERLLISSLSRAFPDDSFLGEESGVKGEGRCRWIIDPIDGTVDFMASFPDYTISVAFEDENGIAFGIVMVPRQAEEFTAFRGEGAYLNGMRIHTDETSPLGKTLAILVPPHRHHKYLHGYMERMERFYSVISDMRSLGSAAISLCYVAAGRVSMYYEIGLHIYDCAAGIIIVREAGGAVTLLTEDEDWIEIAASSRAAHDAMMRCIDG